MPLLNASYYLYARYVTRPVEMLWSNLVQVSLAKRFLHISVLVKVVHK